MSEKIKCPEGCTNSTISTIEASIPEKCDSIVTVTVNINRKSGDKGLSLKASLKDSSKVKFVGIEDETLTIDVPDNINTASFQVRNITGAGLTNAIVFELLELKKGGATIDNEVDNPTVTWIDCPAQPCDECSKCDCSRDIIILNCDSVTDYTIDTTIRCSGRILKLTVNVNNVCPNRKIALAAFILENDVLKGVRFKEVTSGVGTVCQNVTTTMLFVLPDSNACAATRILNARVIANYVDLGNDTIPCCC